MGVPTLIQRVVLLATLLVASVVAAEAPGVAHRSDNDRPLNVTVDDRSASAPADGLNGDVPPPNVKASFVNRRLLLVLAIIVMTVGASAFLTYECKHHPRRRQ